MEIDQHHLQEQMKRCEEAIRNAGIRVTHQRMEIFKELLRTNEHPDAEMIWEKVQYRLPSIALDTVYRTLWLFLDLDLINSLGVSRESARFDSNMEPHHHFVCSNCGATLDFYCQEFDEIEPPGSVKELGKAEKIQVEVRGVCKRCLSKGADEEPDE